MQRPCRNPKCGKLFTPKSSINWFCSDQCRRAVRGSEYRKARAIALYRDQYTCTEPGCTATTNLECHHKLPLYKGGDHSLTNLQTLCRPHHKTKHKTYKEDSKHEQTSASGTARSAGANGPGRRKSEVYDHAA